MPSAITVAPVWDAKAAMASRTARGAVVARVGHDRAVDLDVVGAERAQELQPGISGADVVEGHAGADRPEGDQRGDQPEQAGQEDPGAEPTAGRPGTRRRGCQRPGQARVIVATPDVARLGAGGHAAAGDGTCSR